MGRQPAAGADPDGAWTLGAYRLVQRHGPRSRGFAVVSPHDEILAYCMVRKDRGDAVFVAPHGDRDAKELLVLTPKQVKLFAAAFDVTDPNGSGRVGEVRKREYKVIRKEEWFLLDAEGETVGMVTRNPSRLEGLQRLRAVRLFFPVTYQVHWRQAIAGSIQERTDMGLREHLRIDLSLHPEPEVDRRLVLATAFAIREGGRIKASDGPA